MDRRTRKREAVGVGSRANWEIAWATPARHQRWHWIGSARAAGRLIASLQGPNPEAEKVAERRGKARKHRAERAPKERRRAAGGGGRAHNFSPDALLERVWVLCPRWDCDGLHERRAGAVGFARDCGCLRRSSGPQLAEM